MNAGFKESGICVSDYSELIDYRDKNIIFVRKSKAKRSKSSL